MTTSARVKDVSIWVFVFVFLVVMQVQFFEVILGEPSPALWLVFLIYFMFYRSLSQAFVVLGLTSFFLSASSALSLFKLIVSLFATIMIGSEIQKKFLARQEKHFFLACLVLVPLWMLLYFGSEIAELPKLKIFIYTVILILPMHRMMRLCDRYDSQ